MTDDFQDVLEGDFCKPMWEVMPFGARAHRRISSMTWSRVFARPCEEQKNTESLQTTVRFSVETDEDSLRKGER